MLDKKCFLTIVFCVCLISIISGMSFSAEAIKIGVAGPHSGGLASYGIPTVRAAELVVNKVNSQGGVLSEDVEVFTEDDACVPATAANIATQFVNQGIDVVLGHICSGATLAALATYKNAAIVVMSPTSTNPELTQSGDYPNFFRTIAPDDAQARLIVDYALNILKLSKIAVVHDNQAYGKGLAELVKGFLEADARATVVLYESIIPGLMDYSNLVQNINQSNAEAAIYCGYHPEASKIITKMREMNMDTLFISDDAVKDDSFIVAAGNSAEGVYASAPKDLSNNSMYQLAVEEHVQAYGEDPGPFFPQAYAATMALLNAIKNAGSTNQEAVSEALRSNSVETPLGRIRFDEKGDAIGVGFSMYKVINGEFVEVYVKKTVINLPSVPLLLLY
jgi:branched-chain amino acid transport system substrate-binding protein